MENKCVKKCIKIFAFFFTMLCFLSCGLIQTSLNSSDLIQASRVEDSSAGEFHSPAGRLNSKKTCADNKDCRQLCDSMLEKWADQEKML